jgi:hypothetical protein
MLLLALAAPSVGASKRRRRGIPIKPVGLFDWGGHLYLKGTIDGEKRSQKGLKTTEEQWIFEEGVELNAKGYAYHPNLFDWIATVRMGLSQETLMLNDVNHETDGTLMGYTFSGLFLKEKPVSVQIFANQNQNLRDQNFAESTRGETQRQGVMIRYRGLFPASLLVETGSDLEESERRNVDSDIMHINFKIADKRNRNWLTELEFDREDVDETSTFFIPGQTTGDSADLSEIVDEFNLRNTWLFGPGEDKHSLAGGINILDRKGFFPSKRLLADQRLDLIHSKTLSSFYQASIDSEETDLETEDILEGEIGVMKKIYKSLDLTLRGTGRERSIGDDSETVIGGFVDANYRKRTPIGQYTSSLLVGRELEDQKSSTGVQRFNQDTRVKLDGLNYSFLTSNNIINTSIIVTDTNNTLPAYIRGIDYTIRQTGQVTEIARLAGGIIADGQTVFVDYISEGTGDVTFRTDHLRWRHRLALKHLPLSIYANFILRDETLIDGTDPGYLDNDRNLLLGTELDWRGLRVAVEREKQDSILSPPSLSHRMLASYFAPLGQNSRLSLNARAEQRVYLHPDKFELADGQEKLDTVNGSASFTTKIGANTLLNLTSTYLKAKGRQNNEQFTNGFSLQWQYGKIDFSVEGTYDIYEQEEVTGTAFNMMFYLKRKF